MTYTLKLDNGHYNFDVTQPDQVSSSILTIAFYLKENNGIGSYKVFANDILEGRPEDYINQFKEKNQSFKRKASLALVLQRTPLNDKGKDAIAIIATFIKLNDYFQENPQIELPEYDQNI